ncbi:MAG: KR domain-containing protein [Deltaproteobacteria bacterium]|nr:KR domain-containing protein [Deltaproteobacteria bacterium]
MYPPGPDFVASYLACLRASVIPQPIWLPNSDWAGFVQHLESSEAETALILTLATEVSQWEKEQAQELRLRWVATDTLPGLAWDSSELRDPPLSFSSHVPLWRQSAPRPPFEAAEVRRWLFFVDDYGVVSDLVERMRRLPGSLEPEVSLVRPGEGFERIDEGLYTIDPGCPQHYLELIADLVDQDRAPDYILHGWSISVPPQGRAPEPASASREDSDFESRLAFERNRLAAHRVVSFDSLEFLARALGRQLPTGPRTLTILSNDLHRVMAEDNVEPDKAFLLGAVRELPRNLAGLVCRNIDLCLKPLNPPGNLSESDRLTQDLLSEIVPSIEDANETVVALRGESRWVQNYGPLCLKGESVSRSRLREGGVYLITGGLEGAGLPLAEELSLAVRPRLVILSDHEIPERGTWDSWVEDHGETDPTSRSIFKLCELEEVGAEVLVLKADLNDPSELELVIGKAEERFGPLHGVIHCIGGCPVGNQDAVASEPTPETSLAALASRVEGTLSLDCLLRGRPLDFFVLFSLVGAERGREGALGRAAASAFLGAFAQSRFSRQGTLVAAIDWDCHTDPVFRSGEIRGKLPAHQMFDVFRRVLDLGGVSQVLVSSGEDLLKGKG